MRVGGRSRVFALLGDPVAHSASPDMLNAAFAVLGLDAVYVALRVRADRIAPVMRMLAEAGGGGNVTVPHKRAAALAVDRMEGPLPTACNTFWGTGETLVGDNTDVAGILSALDRLAAPPTRWLVVGTGGAAHAVAAAARERSAALGVRSRDPARAAAFLAEVAEGLERTDAAACEVVINATPLGLGSDDPLPITPGEAPSARWGLDLVYRGGETPWVHAMRVAGRRAADGRDVLVHQGTAAMERWFPGVVPPLDVMRAAIRAGLG
jgi:shikimate dehydrogenase